MARGRDKTKGRKDAPGGFAGIPRIVMEHPDYVRLSGNAVKALLMLAYQYKGGNNGDLCAAWAIAQKHGFKSEPTLSRAMKELMPFFSSQIHRTEKRPICKHFGF